MFIDDAENQFLTQGGIPIATNLLNSLPKLVFDKYNQLNQVEQKAFRQFYERRKKSTVITYLLWPLGCQYFYLNKWGIGALYLLSGGGFIVWAIVDVFRLGRVVKKTNDDIALTLLGDLTLLGEASATKYSESTPTPSPVNPEADY